MPHRRHARVQRPGPGQQYLDWAVQAFRSTAHGVADETQIHAHMCYSECSDIMAAATAMDCDVIAIATAPSDRERLAAFAPFGCPNRIGPGTYNIHSPNILAPLRTIALIKKTAERMPAERLWVNPDCGLKTRQRAEAIPALARIVAVARALRAGSD